MDPNFAFTVCCDIVELANTSRRCQVTDCFDKAMVVGMSGKLILNPVDKPSFSQKDLAAVEGTQATRRRRSFDEGSFAWGFQDRIKRTI